MPESEASKSRLVSEIELWHSVLSQFGGEFGYRAVSEIRRFIGAHQLLTPTTASSFDAAFDAQIVQKLLPKLSGSRRELEPILVAVAVLCERQRTWVGDPPSIDGSDELRKAAIRAAKLDDLSLHPLDEHSEPRASTMSYPLGYGKACRMLQRLTQVGFASFAEA